MGMPEGPVHWRSAHGLFPPPVFCWTGQPAVASVVRIRASCASPGYGESGCGPVAPSRCASRCSVRSASSMHDGRDVTPDGTLQRRLLALLVVRRGHVVSPDAAIEALWPAGRPRDPGAALQNHLYRLRRDLPAGVVESTANGYRLEPSAIELDADRLVEALRGGAAMDGAARSAVDAILARWHGPAYPELADVDEGRTEAARLEELRVQAAEARAEQRLAAGDTDGLVAELTALADEHPLRERPRALSMATLAATGRTVEALRVYDDFRRLLGDELGIEPSPTLTAQHAELLRGAPAQAWAPVSRLPVPVTSLVGRDGARRRAGRSDRRSSARHARRPRRRRQDAAARRARTSSAGRPAVAPGRAVRAGVGDRGIGRRRRRRGAGDRRPPRRRARRTRRHGARRHRARAPARQLRTRPRCGRRVGRPPARRLPERPRRGHQPGAAARRRRTGAPRPDVAVVRRRRSGRRAVRRPRPRRGAGLRARSRRAGDDRRHRAPPRRAAAGHRAGHGAPPHARGCRGRHRARPPLRPAVDRLSHGVAPWLARRGDVVVARSARSAPAARLRRPVGVHGGVHRGRRRGDLRPGSQRRQGRSRSARRALAGDAGTASAVHAARDAAGVRRRAACGERTTRHRR